LPIYFLSLYVSFLSDSLSYCLRVLYLFTSCSELFSSTVQPNFLLFLTVKQNNLNIFFHDLQISKNFFGFSLTFTVNRHGNLYETIKVVSLDDLILYGNPIAPLKGTQDWSFFWLRFWNLRYFFVSYVKILRFYKKNFDWPIIGGGTIFPRSPRTTKNEKKFWGRSEFLFLFSSIMDPKYDPILVFWKFNQLKAAGTTLYVDLGSKCQILFPLVWD
jgi:hypothetical protein